MTPTVAVAIATCGRVGALRRCLDAIVAGDDRPDELIVVDQAPSSDAERVVAATGLAHRYVAQQRIGLSGSRNLALASTSSDILATTDEDCVPDPRWTDTIRRSFVRDPALTATTGPVLPTRAPEPGEYSISQRSQGPARTITARQTPWRVGTGGNFAARVEVVRMLGGWDERLGVGTPGRAGEDIELIDRILRHADARIRFDPDQLVRHQPRDAAARLETRWSYGFGIGAFLGQRARARDGGAVPMLADYLRMHVVAFVNAAARADGFDVRQHARALGSLPFGFSYGLRLSPRQGAGAALREEPP